MTLTVLKPGLQTTLQGVPRLGYRHMGMPWSGPADSLSMALANRLVANPAGATALEITYGGVSFRFDHPAHFALTGAANKITLDGAPISPHQTQHARSGSVLDIAMPVTGLRTYLAIASGFVADTILGSPSTYLPAGLGGHHGRALQAGDRLNAKAETTDLPNLKTPLDLRPYIGDSFALRACPSAEAAQLSPDSTRAFYSETFQTGRQIDRMGLTLETPKLAISSDGKMKSAAVFPGTVQCPRNGQPIILMADAQTTGGYPRIAHIARCDQHLLGQIRPGAHVRFIQRTLEQAIADYDEKSALFGEWLPNFRL